MQQKKIFMIIVLIGSLFLISFDYSGDAHAQTKITVENRDDPGEGFNDPSPADPASTAGGNTGATLGDQRFIAFQFAADIWANIIESSVEIKVSAKFDPLDCDFFSAVLGSAEPNTAHAGFDGAPQALTWYPQALANSLAETDLAPILNDIVATFNSSIGTTCPFPVVWYYGLDRNPPDDTTDFVTVVLHELGHGLGFLTFVDLISGAKLKGLNDTYMLNLEDHTTGKLYPDMTREERRAASINITNLHWVGPDVIAESTGLTDGRHEPSGHVEMFAFVVPLAGSSVSHFSPSLSPDELMEPFFTGVDHQPGLATVLMKDIGWATSDTGPTVIFEGSNATGIRNLNVGGTLYNVDFLSVSAKDLYGDNPPIFDFSSNNAVFANAAVVAALNSESAVMTVGPANTPFFAIGFDIENDLVAVINSNYLAVSSSWQGTDVDTKIPGNVDTKNQFELKSFKEYFKMILSYQVCGFAANKETGKKEKVLYHAKISTVRLNAIPGKHRLVESVDPIKETTKYLLTNELTWEATQIISVYSYRWVIEEFFRNAKQLTDMEGATIRS